MAEAGQQWEPSLHDGGLTIFSGATFVLSDAIGQMRAEPHGFFVDDQRALSVLRLHVEEHEIVVLRAGLTADEPELRAFCQARLARYKVPARVTFADALPRNAAGKLLRRQL